MSFPTIREIVNFIFHHDQWRKDQEVAEFRRMAEALANRHDIEKIPSVQWLLEHSDEMFEKLQQRNWRFWVLIELDIKYLVEVDHDSMRITIPENPFGRFIPVHELFDHAIQQCGEVESITVDPGGMLVKTSYGFAVKLPGCEIYLGRLAEDGHRYRNAAILIEYATDGSVQLDWKELVGKTRHIVVERNGESWKVDTGILAST